VLNDLCFRRIDVPGESWPVKLNTYQAATIFQTPAWLEFLSRTQQGEPVVAAFVVQKFGVRILGNPFPGWSTAYMGLVPTHGLDRGKSVEAPIDFAFRELKCIHLEIMDRNLKANDLRGLDVQYRLHRGFEIDLTCSEEALFPNMSSACRRCIRKAQKEVFPSRSA
jgi:hypothetical protein